MTCGYKLALENFRRRKRRREEGKKEKLIAKAKHSEIFTVFWMMGIVPKRPLCSSIILSFIVYY